MASSRAELIYRHPWPTHAAVRNAIAKDVEMFYNPQRPRSALGYLSPAKFERREQPMVLLAA